MGKKGLSVKQKLGFGIFDLGGNMFFTLMGFWTLNFLTDTVGLAAALAGAAFMAGKVWDAVTDPLMGYISDRTLSRWGRRRPYLLFGALPMALALWFFFTKPGFTGTGSLVIWATLALALLNTAATVINIPYSSLTPELTDDYHERTSLNGYRFGCAIFGTILGAAAVQPLVSRFPPAARGFSMMGLILGAVMLFTTLLTFFGTRERPHTKADLPTEGVFATYKIVFTNKPFVLLLLAYGFHIMALTFLQSILVYYTRYVYNREDLTTLAMIILLLTAMVFIPISVLVSKRIGKKRTYQICFVIIASACLIIFALGHILGPNFFLGFMVYAGIGVGFSYVAPFAMVPDAIDFEAARSGERKEGAYYGMWTFVSKLGTALSAFLSGIILSLGGYIAGVDQGAGAIMAIRFLIGPIPAIIFIGALVVMQFYSLDEKAYQEIQAKEHKDAQVKKNAKTMTNCKE
ncbi:sugar transporter [Treponema primitia ZAS-2]|uniref:Sugar transporter n=1 Tax=Treponema primitia (strain ATCC BAA-887 / DSM 12427 / ZAS-2) TaxID=545694 RepID=F5YQG7_TREPZ|nr:glycoside-pentoside-hexuronide (GPH):cation symporter [Treponema primitia]AEF84811.1 sugar transporter [Treponema primitia ZAS-2]